MRYFLLFCFCAFTLHVNAQTDTSILKKNITAGMDSISTALVQKDWNSFSTHMHPTLLQMLGGKEKFVVFLEQQMKSMEEATINKTGTGNVLQLLRYNNQWQCVVESYLEMTVEATVISSVSSNLGISYDNGASWKFIRLSNGNEEQMKKMFNDLSPDLQVPNNKTAVGVTLIELLKTYKPVYTTTN